MTPMNLMKNSIRCLEEGELGQGPFQEAMVPGYKGPISRLEKPRQGFYFQEPKTKKANPKNELANF